MTAAPLHFGDERLMLDPAGAAFWPARDTLIVADLHFEKASALAMRGALLPPYDTKVTLERLIRLVRLYRPATVIALGDSFHDNGGVQRLSAEDRARIIALASERAFIWIIGNHDTLPSGLPGTAAPWWRVLPFTFRHQAKPTLDQGEIEVSGHFHPKAKIESRAKWISRPCFVAGAARLMLPAFGAYTGGLDVRDPAIRRLFAAGPRVFLLGRDRLHSFTFAQLAAWEETA